MQEFEYNSLEVYLSKLDRNACILSSSPPPASVSSDGTVALGKKKYVMCLQGLLTLALLSYI